MSPPLTAGLYQTGRKKIKCINCTWVLRSAKLFVICFHICEIPHQIRDQCKTQNMVVTYISLCLFYSTSASVSMLPITKPLIKTYKHLREYKCIMAHDEVLC